MLTRVTIEGISPLLQHSFVNFEEASEQTRVVHIARTNAREAAKQCEYRNAAGALFLPGAAIARLLREAGAAHKQRGSRKSLKYVVPGAVFVPEDEIVLTDPTGAPLTAYEVDSRPVTIPATKGRIMRHRPRLNSWRASFLLEIVDEFITAAAVRQLVEEGGRGVGVGDFRPERGGPFGRFKVVGWEDATAAEGKAA